MDIYIPWRVIFAFVMAIATLLIIFLRKFIYASYRRPLRKRFLRAIQVILPIVFSLVCSSWLRQSGSHLFSALVWVIIPFCVFYFTYHYFLNWAEDQVALELKEEKISRAEERLTFESQISKLLQIVALEEYWQKLIKSKSKRFLDFYKGVKSGTIVLKGKNNEVFQYITQPQEQFVTMVSLIHEYFIKHVVPEPHACNVTVMVPVGDNLRFAHYKEAPRSIKRDIFGYGRSAAGKAWQKGKILIVPDKQKELRDVAGKRLYDPGERDISEDAGSLICFPVFDYDFTMDHKEALIFIINITSSKSNNFLADDQAHYEKILSSLSERMILENRLLKIKDELGKKG